MAKRSMMPIKESSVEWRLGVGLPPLKLTSVSDDTPLSESSDLYFTSDGWPDEASATAAASRYVGAVAKALACLRIGVDYGDRAPGGGGFSDWLLQKMWDEHGFRVLNEQPGVMVYETEPTPIFGSMSGEVRSLIPVSEFEAVFEAALADAQPLTPHERVAIALFNAAFFEESQDSRFLLNMMALEALVDRKERLPDAVSHLDRLIELTQSAHTLSQSDRDSLCGALTQLKCESIGQSGRRLVAQLEGRQYSGRDPVSFFRDCYSLRSRLVHGDCDLPAREEVATAAASLEVMVSDLLSGNLSGVRRSAASG